MGGIVGVKVTDKAERVNPGQRYCDGCTSLNAEYRLEANPGDGYTTRTMRLCPSCFYDMGVAIASQVVEVVSDA